VWRGLSPLEPGLSLLDERGDALFEVLGLEADALGQSLEAELPPREVGPGDMLDLDLGGRPQLLRWYNNRGLVTSSRYCIGDGYL
jgi:hypothetical protein